ncbi:MAG TPA: DUF5691 domain-containing protein [Ktedonobacteraceae bacterium]|nr:DUF5691 domain-containing protein [Ktedonobacteraceae bacterium]
MHAIVTTAIVGTGQQDTSAITTGTAIDALATQLPDDDRARKLLLTAGAWSVYRQAGYVIAQAPDAPQPAAPETLPVCSPEAERLLANLLQEEKHRALFLEALKRLKQAGKRLPYNLLPQALTEGAQSKELRPPLALVIGERGRWLSQLNPAWAWVAQFLSSSDEALPADAEMIWQEGTTGQRCELLRRLRVADPAKAREWLAVVWKKEKADARADFLATFEVSLSAEDEPFLEQALDDRSTNVRTLAASLLARIPTSALVRRMLARADTILTYQQGKLTVTLPTTLDQDWHRDNLASVSDKNTQWAFIPVFQRVLSLVPPNHWEKRFAATPEQLIAAAQDSEYKHEMLEGWSEAALLHNQPHWIAPLVERLFREPAPQNVVLQLVAYLPQQEAENKVLQIAFDDSYWFQALAQLPRPWSKEFGEACLQALRNYAQTFTNSASYYYHRENILELAASSGLPLECFETALQTWELPDDTQNNWHIQRWQQKLAEFTEILKLRKRIIEEIV